MYARSGTMKLCLIQSTARAHAPASLLGRRSQEWSPPVTVPHVTSQALPPTDLYISTSWYHHIYEGELSQQVTILPTQHMGAKAVHAHGMQCMHMGCKSSACMSYANHSKAGFAGCVGSASISCFAFCMDAVLIHRGTCCLSASDLVMKPTSLCTSCRIVS